MMQAESSNKMKISSRKWRFRSTLHMLSWLSNLTSLDMYIDAFAMAPLWCRTMPHLLQPWRSHCYLLPLHVGHRTKKKPALYIRSLRLNPFSNKVAQLLACSIDSPRRPIEGCFAKFFYLVKPFSGCLRFFKNVKTVWTVVFFRMLRLLSAC